MTFDKYKSKRSSRKSRSRNKKSRRSKKSKRLRGSSIWPRSRTGERDDRRDSGSTLSQRSQISEAESPRERRVSDDMKVVHIPSNRGSGCRMLAYAIAVICIVSAVLYAAHRNNYLEHLNINIPYLQQQQHQ